MATKTLGSILAVAVMLLMVASAILAFAMVSPATTSTVAAAPGPLAPSPSHAGAIPSASAAATSSPAGYSLSPTLPASVCSSLQSTQNDPAYAGFVHRIDRLASGASGTRLSSANLPYAGPIADQTVNGIAQAGSILSQECGMAGPHRGGASQTAPTGVAYDGQIDNATGIHNVTLDSNSVAGILTVNSQTENLYPGSGTPTTWGAQENNVLTNVTILGSQCPTSPCAANGKGNYAFWTQNVVSYDSYNDTLYFVDDTWNFTSFSSAMFNSSLVSWSPDGGNYTGVWVAFSPYFHVPPPFTVTVYVNTSVNSAGDEILWYNYSISSPTVHVSDGNYDYLVFNSQPAGGHVSLAPPDFEASATVRHVVTEGYEFDAFIGADDGANQLMLGANATMQVQYCVATPYCTPSHYAYANVPAAVNYGSQTGEQTIGIAVNYLGTTAYLSAGPLIAHGLWNFTGETGVAPGATKVVNAITVSGSPIPVVEQPYFFVFFNNTAFNSQGYQWAPDVPAWYLMPGTYNYTVLLADYTEENGTLIVPSSGTVTLSVTLPYNPRVGVYTPLWAFGNAQLAGISSSGSGSIGDQYMLFNNPTTGYFGFPADNLSVLFLSADDYSYPSFTGVLLKNTSAYADLYALPSFGITATFRRVTATYYLGMEFYGTSHVTLSHDTNVQGWPEWSEISFYASVPASQNPAPQADVFVWNSTSDLIMSNTFVGTQALRHRTPPDALVLFGGTNNTVWGNTFEDPPGVALNATYAGIGEGDHGDLIYNNHFSVDNPVVYLPYNWNNVADCLPQSLGGCANNETGNSWYYNNAANVIGNTWNVTPQPASDVAHTVNGFPLSGNVLGPSVATQGGNYYWNYGTSPNNRSTTPYVSRFYYSDWSYIYPLGCGTIQAPNAPCGTPPPLVGAYQDGMAVGGDYAAYGPTVTFAETGLPAGASWTVTIGGIAHPTTHSSLSIAEPYGLLNYTITTSESGYQPTPASGSVLASGIPTVHVTFASTSIATSVSASPSHALSASSLVMFSATLTISGTPATGTVTLYLASSSGAVLATYPVAVVSGHGSIVLIPGILLATGATSLSYWVEYGSESSAPSTLTFSTAAPTTLTLAASPSGSLTTFTVSSNGYGVAVTLVAMVNGVRVAAYTVGLDGAGTGTITLVPGLLGATTEWEAVYGTVVSNTVTVTA